MPQLLLHTCYCGGYQKDGEEVMTVIVHGKDNELFETDNTSVPHSIIELYNYCEGTLRGELFSKIIEGMIETATISDMVDVFNHLSIGNQIVKIYAYADIYFTMDGGVKL